MKPTPRSTATGKPPSGKSGRRSKPSSAPAQWLNLSGQPYVIVPAADYLRLRHQAGEISQQDMGDIAEAQRVLSTAAEKPVPYAQVRSRLRLR